MEEFILGALGMDEDTLTGRMMTFMIGNETYGVEISFVTEIIGIQKITEIPEMPEYVKGIINLRGRIIPLMDVRLRFKMAPREYDDRTCVIVIEYKDISFGLIVDSVSEVLTISENNIVDLPALQVSQSIKYVKKIGRIGQDVMLILDCENLLSLDDIQILGNISEVS